MSLLSRFSRLYLDRISIAVRCDRISIARLGALTKKSAMLTHTEPVDSGEAGALLDTLERLLADPRWRNGRARVFVSDRLVRYCLLPSSKELVSPADEESLASHRIRHIHGGLPGDWHVRLGNPLSGSSQPVAAMESAFILRLMEVLGSASLVVKSIEPLFMRAYNVSRPRLGGERFWFANVESDSVSLARIERGCWRSLAVRSAGEDFADRLTALRNEMRLMGDASGEDGPCYAYAPGIPWANNGLVIDAGWENVAIGVWSGHRSGETHVAKALGV